MSMGISGRCTSQSSLSITSLSSWPHFPLILSLSKDERARMPVAGGFHGALALSWFDELTMGGFWFMRQPKETKLKLRPYSQTHDKKSAPASRGAFSVFRRCS